MKSYKNYLLIVLTLIVLFSYVDRLALGVVLQDIRTEFQLSDTQLGFLGGIAFALVYSVMGIPIARWADGGDRVLIICISTALWSLGVFLCGWVAATFVQLLLVRVVAAIGAAGCNPAALSLLADCFKRDERTRATVIYGLAGSQCALVGYLGAGWLNELYGWRTTFMLLGTPGLILALLAWLTLHEPRRSAPRDRVRPIDSATGSTNHPSLLAVGRMLWNIRTVRHLLLCSCIQTFFAYGIGQWHAPFFVRSHGLTTGQIGTWLTISAASSGLLGTWLVMRWSAWPAAHKEARQLAAMSLAIGTGATLTVLVYLVPNAHVAFALMALAGVGLTTTNGPLIATIQTLVPERMRAVAFALIFLCAGLIGAGFGPLLSGALSDALRPWAGEESLRYALLIISPGYLWAAWHARRASNLVAQDLAAVPLEDDALDNESALPALRPGS